MAFNMQMGISRTSVLRSLRSARMRARTGKAVMDSATPRNRAKAPKLDPKSARRNLFMIQATIAPRPNGRIMPAAAIHAAITPELLRKNHSRNWIEMKMECFNTCESV